MIYSECMCVGVFFSSSPPWIGIFTKLNAAFGYYYNLQLKITIKIPRSQFSEWENYYQLHTTIDSIF